MKTPQHELKILYWDKDSKEVAIGPWPEVRPDKYAHFGSTGWDAYTALRKASFEERKTMIFIEFAHLVVRDGIDPKALHNLLLKEIPEYRDGLADDMQMQF